MHDLILQKSFRASIVADANLGPPHPIHVQILTASPVQTLPDEVTTSNVAMTILTMTPRLFTDTFKKCLKACDASEPGSSAEAHIHASYVDVDWEAGNLRANCYLKSQIATINHNNVMLSSGYHASDTLPESGVSSPGNGPVTISTSAVRSTEAANLTALPPSIAIADSDSHAAFDVDVIR